MFKKIILLSFGMFLYTGLFAQSNEHFKFSPEEAYNGKAVTIMYDAKGTTLEGRKQIHAVVYQYIDYQWNAVDVKLAGSNNSFKADFQIPETCGMLALKFVSDTLTDNNHDQGYFMLMHDKDRKGLMAKGAFAGWGLARSPKYNMDIPNYIKFEGVSDSATYHWLNQEITFNPSSKSTLVYPYALALQATFKEDAAARLQRVMTYLKRPEASESDLLNARKISMWMLKQKTLTDSIETVLRTRFPKGSLTRLDAAKKLATYRDVDGLLSASLQFLKDFPEKQTNAQFDAENRINYGLLYQNVMVFGAMKDINTPNVVQYVDSLSYEILPTVYYKLIAIPYHRKEGDRNKLAEYSNLLVKRFDYFKQNRPSAMSYLSPEEWASAFQHTFVTNVSTVHIGLLNGQKKYAEALKYAVEAEQVQKFKSGELNDEYASILKNLGQDKALEEVLKRSMFENQSSTEMMVMLKEIYVRRKKTDVGFDDYLNALKNPDDVKKSLAELKSSIINKEMPVWSMQDLTGKTVNSADLKGKTVILDFWATWCVPCKASFPGMKLAVEKYKNDPNVVFYFVDTEERGETYKTEIAKYIKDNHFPFQVLFDNKVAGDKTNSEVFNRICKAFTISGIPQKLIINKNGRLRFISIGFKGSATGLADEMSNLIEMTKTAD